MYRTKLHCNTLYLINTKLATGLVVMIMFVLFVPTFLHQDSAAFPYGKSFLTVRGYGNLHIQNGLTIQGTGYTLTGNSNQVQTSTVQTDHDVNIQLLMWDKLNSIQKKHVVLYLNLNGNSREIKDSDTYLRFDTGLPLQVNDPNGYFSQATVTSSENGNYITLNYHVTFAKPMQKSNMILCLWDDSKKVENTKIINVIEVDKSPDTNIGG